jgi:plastocyanin
MSPRRITTVLSCGAFAFGGAAVSGCGKDTNAADIASTTTTTTIPRSVRTVTAPRKRTKTGDGRSTTTPAKAPKPTKAAKRPKKKILEQATLVVLMKHDKFAPAQLRAKIDQPITWRNDDRHTHNVTAVGGAGFRSGPVKHDGTYTFTPQKKGTINYVCTIHPGQRGRIDVIG